MCLKIATSLIKILLFLFQIRLSLVYTKFLLEGLNGPWSIAIKLPNIWSLKGHSREHYLKRNKSAKHVEDVEYKASFSEIGRIEFAVTVSIFASCEIIRKTLK